MKLSLSASLRRSFTRLVIMLLSLIQLALLRPSVAAEQSLPTPLRYDDWKHSGSMWVLTTPEGADLPASAVLEGVPLLVRLHKDFFDFRQALPQGEDLRFSLSNRQPLDFQIEEWDANQGVASVWVRVPKITGNSRQELKMYWGNADAENQSAGKAVFNESNGYLSVWHMGDPVRDEVGTLPSTDTGTTATTGMIGAARHLPGGKGVFCGDKILNYPSGASSHSTEAWFRIEQPNATIIGWGNEGGGRGSKVRMQFRSPPHIKIDSDFSDVKSDSRLSLGEWIHVVHTYDREDGRIYINGQLDGAAKPLLDIKSPARLWLGGWYNNYDFVGDLDEVRISRVARSADWIKLQYENQKPHQTLVGPLVQPGNEFSVSYVVHQPDRASDRLKPEPGASALRLINAKTLIEVAEGQSATVTAKVGGAQKVVWILKRDGKESVVATNRFSYTFDAGRVAKSLIAPRSNAFDRGAISDNGLTATLTVKAIYAHEVKSNDIAITISDDIPDPVFTLTAPAVWDGRTAITVVSQVTNLSTMQAKGAGELKTEWSAGPFAVIKEIAPGKLILKRAQNSGKLTVTATISNGGKGVTQSATIAVTEPKSDPWAVRTPAKDEKPEDGQFYARDDKNAGTLDYNGTLAEVADAVFLKLYADDKLIKTESGKLAADKSYALAVKLKPGLIKYKVEFGSQVGGQETVLQTVHDIVCGDAYIIEGQSNALATDTGEKSPPDTNEWIRSYGRPSGNPKDALGNLWCKPVWKAQNGEKAELGWWGMELAKRLVESQKVPIFIINAAVGGTRIDQHQRNESAPTDLNTIYGRMLWRVQQAKLTHGIRGILWHQGESDQGSDGPTGGYGWETYQQLFVEMSAAWKQDFPNVKHYYIFQIWPNACSMGGRDGSGDLLREKQRTLPQLFSNMSIMSTLGVRPPGGCHYPLVGWAELARTIQPLMERDNYGKVPATSITPPNLRRVSFAGSTNDAIALEFDQPVVWTDTLAGQFYLDGEKDKVASGRVTGNVLTLKLKAASAAKKITYLKEAAWNQDTLLHGANGLAALTFCAVPIE